MTSEDIKHHFTNLAPKHARKHVAHPPRVKKKKKEFRLDSNDFGFIWADVINVVDKRLI